jgi:hypothetical protein
MEETMKHTIGRVALAGLSLSAVAALGVGSASAAGGDVRWDSVPAVPKATGVSAPNVLSPQLTQHAVAQGSVRLENPQGDVQYYGYLADGPMLPLPGTTQSPGHNVEAKKTEPDKQTYLRLSGLRGADQAYDYGTHFLFQGHESGSPGYITRINLDADAAHRVTLLATKTTAGQPLPTFDGSTWNPFTRKLLFTAESGPTTGGVWESDPTINAKVRDLSNVLGRGGYEGIQADSAGNLWIVEDSGGSSPTGSKAKNPNSFVYRFVPTDKTDLGKGGKLQALQVISRHGGQPIGFTPIDATHPNGGILTDDIKDLHTYGTTLDTRWVTIHEGDASSTPFDANAAAKVAKATPFKRPENGVFRPGMGFKEFFFTETGDTNADSNANGTYGGWGGVLKLTQAKPGSDQGKLSVFYNGDKAHTGLDNITFIDRDHVAAGEDGGDTLHTQRAALDSAYLFDVNADYKQGQQPVRFLAEGRDPSATVDSALAAAGNGFQNDGDNEITGLHASDGDATVSGLFGARTPTLFRGGWRLFWGQQHGDNTTWEITRG